MTGERATFKFELGEGVRDLVSHFCGTVTGRAEYLGGRRSYEVTSLDASGRPVECWYAEERLAAFSDCTISA